MEIGYMARSTHRMHTSLRPLPLAASRAHARCVVPVGLEIGAEASVLVRDGILFSVSTVTYPQSGHVDRSLT